jgi:PHP family Zn ribbon phosphoesterase
VPELARVAPEKVAEAVDRMRKGQVHIAPGHDGEYGVIRILGGDGAADPCASQLSLF